MTRFLKSTACVLGLAVAVVLPSCKNEEEQREEANASIVNIEKGVTDPVWTSDIEAPAALPKEDKQEIASEQEVKEEQSVEQIQQDQPVEQVQTQTVSRQDQPKPEIKPQVKPQAQPELNPQSKQELKTEVKPEQKPTTKPEQKSSGSTVGGLESN